jgi:uncharacterized protein (DUF2236 family)
MTGIPLARPVVHRLLLRAFGPPPFDPGSYAGDPGLFGPGSATWRIIGDQASIVGGLRALLMQLLHPLAVAGVAEHSRYREDAVGRLQRTSAYVVGTAFGALPEVRAVAAEVRGVHRRVRGVAPDGRAYSAEDPHLLTWVSVALTSSFLATHRAYGRGSLPDGGEDAFVAEQSLAAALLDPRVDLGAVDLRELPAEPERLPMIAEQSLPRSVSELESTLASYRPELRMDAQGRAALRFLLWPRLDPLLRAAYVPLLAGALATLDPDERRLLRIPPTGPASVVARTQTRALLSALRLASGPSPSVRAASRRAAA